MPFGAIFLTAILAWTFLEYVIHAWLGHSFNTFVSPLHESHHRDPHAVFTVGAWLPVLATWTGAIALFGPTPAVIFYTGIVTGFIAYELVHYRIHFVRPANRVEGYLRTRHLVHHERLPTACFGVTSALWDLVFGSEPTGQVMSTLAAAVASTQPLEGPSNLRRILYLGIPKRHHDSTAAQ